MPEPGFREGSGLCGCPTLYHSCLGCSCHSWQLLGTAALPFPHLFLSSQINTGPGQRAPFLSALFMEGLPRPGASSLGGRGIWEDGS